MSDFTDDSLIFLQALGEESTKSLPLPTRGMGSLFIHISASGLVKFHHRVREGGKIFKQPLGYHVSSYAKFSKRFAKADFFTLFDAFDKAIELANEGIRLGSFATAHSALQNSNPRSKKPLATTEQLLRAFMKAREGRDCYRNIKSIFDHHLFVENDAGEPLFANFLQKKAADVVAADANPLFDRLLNDLGLAPSCFILYTWLSAAFSWGKSQERDVTEDRIDYPFSFAISNNDFLGGNPYHDFVSYGKPQLTDLELWLLWHESLPALGLLVGRFIRTLISCGGVRQRHLIRAKWSDFESDNVIPNIELYNKKTGQRNNYRKQFYRTVLGPLALYEVLELRKLTGYSDYLFPAVVGKDNTRNHVRDIAGFNYHFKKFQRYITTKYGLSMRLLTMGMIRTTVSTRMGLLNINEEVIRVIQNHGVSDVVKRSYDGRKNLDKKLNALLVWEGFLRDFLHRSFEAVEDIFPESEKVSEQRPARVIPQSL